MAIPIILIAFSNDIEGQFLRNLADEQKKIHKVFENLHEKKLIELRVLTNVTADDIFEAFLKFGNRIKVFHYAGHAKDFDLLLKESKTSFSIKGFGPFLASHKNLKLVFMNACSTSIQESVLFEAGIPELILTNKPINDETAVDFANLFYKGLASGKTVAESFSSAKHFTQAKSHGANRTLTFSSESPDSPLALFPWKLHQLNPKSSFALRVKPQRWIYLLLGSFLLLIALELGYQLKPAPFDLTIKMRHQSDRQFELNQDIQSVYFIWEGTKYQGEITQKGTVYFSQLPPEINHDYIHLQLESEVWTFQDSLFLVDTKPDLSAVIQPKDTWIRGTLVNAEGKPIENVEVFLSEGEVHTSTNEYGYFRLQVPISLLPSKNILINFQADDSTSRSYYVNPYAIQEQKFVLE